jgi:single-strand DNA-binding protein
MAMGETTITIIGNLTADPEVRFTDSGTAVASFTIASTPRTFDRNTNTWKDGAALFMRCSAWRELGEHVGDSLTKGQRVIATGRLKQRSYEDREGVKRTVVELDVEEVGPSLRFATAKAVKATRNGSTSVGQGEADPWATTPAAPAMAGAGAAGSAWGGGHSDEPPF